MPIVPAITVTQSALTPANVTLVDDSSGSDGDIASRRVSFQTAEGTWLTTAGVSTTIVYETWSYADSTDTWALLLFDRALFIKIEWLDAGGDVLYTFNDYYCLNKFNKNFAVYLGQLQALSPTVLQDSNYGWNMANYWAYIVYAEVMIEEAADISNSQNLLDKATYMKEHQNEFFSNG